MIENNIEIKSFIKYLKFALSVTDERDRLAVLNLHSSLVVALQNAIEKLNPNLSLGVTQKTAFLTKLAREQFNLNITIKEV